MEITSGVHGKYPARWSTAQSETTSPEADNLLEIKLHYNEIQWKKVKHCSVMDEARGRFVQTQRTPPESIIVTATLWMLVVQYEHLHILQEV